MIAPMLFYVKRPRFPVPVMMQTTTVHNMKGAFIHYLYDLREYDDAEIKSIVQVAPPTEEYYRCVTWMDKMAFFERENPDLKTPSTAMFQRLMHWVDVHHQIPVEKQTTVSVELETRLKKYDESLELLFEMENDRQWTEMLKIDVEAAAAETTNLFRKKNYFAVKRRFLQDRLIEMYGIDTTPVTSLDLWLPDVDRTTIHQYYRNSIYSLLHMYPRSVLDGGAKELKSPKHWTFSMTHKGMLEYRVNEYAASFAPFVDDSEMVRLLETFQTRTAPMWNWFVQLPTGRMDEEWLTQIYSYLVVDIVGKYLECLDLIDTATGATAITTGEEDEWQGEVVDLEVALNTAKDTVLDLQKKMETKRSRESRLKSYLQVCLKHERNRLTQVNINYAEVMETVRLHTEREKTSMTDRFRNMTSEGRQVEKLMKKFKLGSWNVGKEVFEYDGAVFDREIQNADLFHIEDENVDEEYDMFANEQEGDGGDEVEEEGNDVDEAFEDQQEDDYADADLEEELER
jgi:hypothetical protein